MNRPLVLLLLTGMALGLNFPLGKLAMSVGISPALWAGFISAGVGVVLLGICILTTTDKLIFATSLRYSFISGFLSYVMPNFLTFSVIAKIGSGFTALMFALSPMVTAVLSLVLGVRPPTQLMLAGIALGMAGAATIVLGKASDLGHGLSLWMLAAVAIPLFLGLGNVYRTRAWPKTATPLLLAATSNLAALPFFAALELMTNGGFHISAFAQVPLVAMAQLAVSVTMFTLFFQLQKIGGPTYLSQIGYVGAAVGLAIGASVLGETYGPLVWLGAGIVAAGIAVSTLAQKMNH